MALPVSLILCREDRETASVVSPCLLASVIGECFLWKSHSSFSEQARTAAVVQPSNWKEGWVRAVIRVLVRGTELIIAPNI